MSEPSYGEKGFKRYPLRFRVLSILSVGFLFALAPAALYCLYSLALGNQLVGFEILLKFDGPIGAVYFITDRLAARAYREGYNRYYGLSSSD